VATIVLQKIGVARTISGNSPQILTLPEAAGTQAFKDGEFVYLSGGKVTEIGANPGIILGVAAQDASGTTNTAIKVYIANADTIFFANKTDSSGTAAVTAYGDVGSVFGIYRDTSNNISHLYADAGTNARCIILDHDNRDTLADTGGRVLFQVAGNFRQMFSTS